MKLLFVVLCALVVMSNGEVDQRIVGGTDATYGDHPYICSLQVKSGNSWYHICGCVIWNRNYAVTAAHCLSGLATNHRVVVGNHQMSSNDPHQRSHGVSAYTRHPNYNGNGAGYPNDIAVLTLSSTIDFNSHVHSFEFASSGSFAGHSCKLSGWGRLSGGVAHGVELDTLIVNGVQATYGDHPYICSLQTRQGFFYYHICGCVIYNRNTVITAAHCLDGASASSLRIQAGLHTISGVEDHQVSRTITKYKMHEYYNGNAVGFPNDIATVQLSSPLTFNSYISNITIDEDPYNSWEGQQCWLTGWGRKSGSGSTANTLKKVSMTKITNSDCARRWSAVGSGAINSGHICFYDPPRSACSGDSGGPVRCGNTLTGVTSWGPSSCSGDYPSVYTRLSTYASWMRNNAF